MTHHSEPTTTSDTFSAAGDSPPPAGLDAAPVTDQDVCLVSTIVSHADEQGWDSDTTARTVVEVIGWVRAHPERADAAGAVAAAATTSWRHHLAPVVFGAVTATMVATVVATGWLTTFLDSLRWPHGAWMVAGAAGLAWLGGWSEDIACLVHVIRAARRARRVLADSDAGQVSPPAQLLMLAGLAQERKLR